MSFEQQNQVERISTSPTHHSAASIAQEAWAPRSSHENTASPVQKLSDMQHALDQGFATVGNLFGGLVHGIEDGVKTVANEVQHVVAPQSSTQPAEQQPAQPAPSESGSSSQERLGHLGNSIANSIGQHVEEAMNPAEQLAHGMQFGIGLVKGLGDLANEAGAAIGYGVTHPGETVAKAGQIAEKIGEKVAGTLATAEHVGEQIGNGDIKGLTEDAQQLGKSIESGVNAAVKGADYLISATPEEQGKFLGHYVLPGIAIGVVTEGVGTAAMGAAMGAMGVGEAALGAGIAVTGVSEAGIALTGGVEMGIGVTGVSEAGIALSGATEVAVNFVGGATQSGLMQVGKTVLKTMEHAVKEGEEGIQGAAKQIKEAFDKGHETVKKAAEVGDQAGNAQSTAQQIGDATTKAVAAASSSDSTLPDLVIVEHIDSDFPEIDRVFGKNLKPITDPKEFEKQIDEMIKNLNKPKKLTAEERAIDQAIRDFKKNEGVYSILDRKLEAIAV